MEELEKSVSVFSYILTKLNGPNMVIGGSTALKLHGLVFSREVNDLDIIIYSPTIEQTEELGRLSKLYPKENSTYLDSKVIKVIHKSFLKRTYKLDIIVENESTPKVLLFVDVFNHKVKVQSISNIVKAKSSYIKHLDSRGSSEYYPKKDISDLLNLKNSNFNL